MAIDDISAFHPWGWDVRCQHALKSSVAFVVMTHDQSNN